MLPAHYLIGVDSDGTAFDSMTLKHRDAFIPAALEIWPMPKEAADTFARIEEDVNLYAETRGINRFPGLLMTFEQLQQRYPREKSIPDTTDFKRYIQEETKYSALTLKRWLEKHPSPEMEKVLAWSGRADVLFEQACEGIQPIPGVRETLADTAKQAAVAVISSAAKVSLEKDWRSGGLLPFVDMLMTQEDGGKNEQLKKAMNRCGEDVHALMLGDTRGDEEAAGKADALFYPIQPGKEAECWRHFRTAVLPAFLAGQFDGMDQQAFAHAVKTEYS